MSIFKSTQFKCIVSSVLNKDTKQYGKNFMFDDEDDTSWSSSQGTPQFIAIQFGELVNLTSFSFQFQGGFAGKDSLVIAENDSGDCIHQQHFYPEDINSVQNFKFDKQVDKAFKIKFIFNSSTDFFGRIIVYKLELF